MNSFYSHSELISLGLKAIGENVLISRKVSIYNPNEIELGNHVRIDDFCILSGKIRIESFVHIAAYVALYGKNGIFIDDYSGISAHCTVFSASDDFSGDYLFGPTVNPEFTNVIGGKVSMEKYTLIGAGCVILPDVIIEEGVAVGAMSLINKTLPAWGMYAGTPAKFIKKRSKKLLNYIK